MIRTIFTLVLLATISNSFAQNSELDERNGFKHIKILSNATDYPELKLDKTKDENYATYVRRNGHLMSIGDIPIKEFEVSTYKNQIYQIDITTPKNPKLFKSLEEAFGKAKFVVTSNNYVWQGSSVKLSFKSLKGGKDTKMTYTSLKIKDIIKQDEEQKIKDLSKDF